MKYMIHNRSAAIRESGFTMMELLIVIVIIGLLASLVGPVLYNRIGPAKQSVTQAQIENFMKALDAYYIDIGQFPTTQQGFQALRVNPGGIRNWRGPYLQKDVPSDPWDNPYIYKSPGIHGDYEIVSYGADGVEGGSDEKGDINSWEIKH